MYDNGGQSPTDRNTPYLNHGGQNDQRLIEENHSLKEVIQTLQVRDSRLEKVDFMQAELEKLIKSTESDKLAFLEKERELIGHLQIKDAELRKLAIGSDPESLRRDHVINNMQVAFVMVL